MLTSIFNKLFSKKKRPILLGDTYVNGRSDFKRFLEFNSNGENSPEELTKWIKDLLDIPVLCQEKDVNNESLILDVAVRKYQAGTDFGLYVNPLIPIFWRPSINVDIRIREYNTNKTIGEYSIKKVMGWGVYFRRVLSLRSILRLRSTFTSEDLKLLLAKSLKDGLIWAKKP